MDGGEKGVRVLLALCSLRYAAMESFTSLAIVLLILSFACVVLYATFWIFVKICLIGNFWLINWRLESRSYK